MLAITLWQPWASLMAVGAKTIETRSWRPHADAIGKRVAIHAAKAKRPEEAAIVALPDFHDALWPHFGFEERPMPTAVRQLLPRGAVVAVGTLVQALRIVDVPDGGPCPWDDDDTQCVHAAIDKQVIVHSDKLASWAHTTVLVEQEFGDYTPGRFAWLFTDIEPLPKPSPAKGKQGFWKWWPREDE